MHCIRKTRGTFGLFHPTSQKIGYACKVSI
jgi:hypothetical protein